MSASQVFPSIIDLNVGGHFYTTSLTTLTKHPDCMLGAMFSGRIPVARDSKGNYFIDRDGQTFRYILNFLRSSKLKVPADPLEREQLKDEADFYQIKALNQALKDYGKLGDERFALKQGHRGDVVRVRLVACPKYSNVVVSVYGGVDVLDEIFPDNGKELGGQIRKTGEVTLAGRTVEGACVCFPMSHFETKMEQCMTKFNDTNSIVIIVLEELVQHGFQVVSTGYRSPKNPREDEDSLQPDDQFHWLCVRQIQRSPRNAAATCIPSQLYVHN